MADKKYVVAARVDSKTDCVVVEEGSIIIGTHRVVYGPETREKCEEWKRRNCK
jgi:hypothetical protein